MPHRRRGVSKSKSSKPLQPALFPYFVALNTTNHHQQQQQHRHKAPPPAEDDGVVTSTTAAAHNIGLDDFDNFEIDADADQEEVDEEREPELGEDVDYNGSEDVDTGEFTLREEVDAGINARWDSNQRQQHQHGYPENRDVLGPMPGGFGGGKPEILRRNGVGKWSSLHSCFFSFSFSSLLYHHVLLCLHSLFFVLC